MLYNIFLFRDEVMTKEWNKEEETITNKRLETIVLISQLRDLAHAPAPAPALPLSPSPSWQSVCPINTFYNVNGREAQLMMLC